MKLHVVAFGCQMSVADGGEMAEPLLARGFIPTAEPEDADAIILNTCTVRQHAEDRALSLIGRLRAWKKADPERVLIVAGCAAERLGADLRRRFSHIDLVSGAKSIEEFPQLIEEALGARFDALKERSENFSTVASEPVGWLSPVSAPVTIMRGCNYSCSYCIVPAVRGRESYRAYEDILAEARKKISLGAKEIFLLGQTVNSWNRREGEIVRKFPDLLRAVANIPGVERVRYESPHPYFIDDAFIEALAATPKAQGYIHMPLQSGSNRILGLMRRNYSAESFLEKVSRVRAAIPEIAIYTDIIVGFPSETPEDFERTLDVVRAFKPTWSYTFKYSPREGTDSAEMPDDVAREEKESRLEALNAVCDRMTEDAMAAQNGRVVSVLDEDGGCGRAADGFRVKWDNGGSRGELFKIAVNGSYKRTLRGERQ